MPPGGAKPGTRRAVRPDDGRVSRDKVDTQLMVRIQSRYVAMIDAQCKALRISRAEWVRRMAAAGDAAMNADDAAAKLAAVAAEKLARIAEIVGE